MYRARPIRLSIVLPVYNVELWIERCLRSILNDRAFSGDCEIIVVDDGSPDRSIEIAEKLCGHWSEVRFIRQINQGLSSARNAGLDAAQGEYVWFIDSDDWLNDGGLTRVLKALIDNFNVDVLNIGYTRNDGKSGEIGNQYLSGRIYSGKQYLERSVVSSPVQFFVWSRKLLRDHSLYFEQRIYHEDALFTPIALYHADRVVRVDCDCYVYNVREGSIMSSGNHLKHAIDMLRVFEKLEHFRLNHNNANQGSKVIAKYSALAVGGIYFYWKRLDCRARSQIRFQMQEVSLIWPVLISWRLKYLFSIVAMRMRMCLCKFISV